MRRVFVFAALLSLVGLSTAMASSFSFQAEDVSSFTTEVSISVPDQPVPLTDQIYVRGPASEATGTLDLQPPAANDSVTGRLLVLSTEPIELQADPTKYFTWQTPDAPPTGYSLNGAVTLWISQNGGGSNLMTAGLFSCPATAPSSSVTGGAVPCTLLRAAIAAPGVGGAGYQERTVSFGTVTASIPAGHQLRLKVVNRAQDGAVVLSTSSWDLQWGYLPARQSRLVIS